MSGTWEQIAEVLAPLPWLAFIAAIAWFKVLELRDDARDSRARERTHPPESDPRIERRASTSI